MSNLLLSQLISTYISSWEGHTQSEGSNLIAVQKRLENATIDEINTEFNSMTQQGIWVPPLITVFYDELLDRLMNETTFAISTAWQNISEWLAHPFMILRVGFEETYPVIDTNGLFIRANNANINTLTLSDDNFSKVIRERIVRLLLHDGLIALVEITPNELQVVGLVSSQNVDEPVLFPNRIRNPNPSQIVRIRVKIQETPDWNMVRRMYQALRDNNPVIIDPFQDRLINQLIDANELEDIIDEEGFTFEGDLAIEVTGRVDQFEEPAEGP